MGTLGRSVGNIKMEPKNGSENVDWTDSKQWPDAQGIKNFRITEILLKYVIDDKLLWDELSSEKFASRMEAGK